MSQYKSYPEYHPPIAEWLPKLPSHWKCLRLRALLQERRERGGEKSDLLAVSQQYGVLPQENLMEITNRKLSALTSNNWSNYKRVCIDDLVYNKMRLWQGAIGLSTYDGIVSPAYVVLTSIAKINGPFYEYLFKTPLFVTEAGKYSQGLCDDMNSCRYEDFKNALTLVPPLNEQQLIAAFLDRETTRIDALLEKKGRFIELLQEKRQALITQAVTKGLDPNANLKNSGVKWLGQVPEHWTVCHLQYVIINIEQGWSPECHSYPAEPGQWGILKSGCVNGGVYNNNENKALPEELSPKPQYEVKAGDILMSRASGSPELIGSVALVANTQDKLMLSDKIFRIQCAVKMNPAFFVNMLNSSALRSQIMHAISGAEGLANNLPQAHIKKFWVTCPPMSEQQTIVSILDQNIARIDALITATQRSMELLKERRTAIITAAVTGQIDLRDSATGEGEIL